MDRRFYYTCTVCTSTAGDYCQWERFTAGCDSAAGEVVVMETARYGRMRLGRCIKYDLGFIGCSTDVLRLADAFCSGRERCEFQLPNEPFDRVNSCLSELKSYLTASYSCLKVISVNPTTCRSSKLIKLLSPVGYLSNAASTSISSLSSAQCVDGGPEWLVEAGPGQRVNITLWDFGSSRSVPTRLAGCIKYATITEVSAARQKVVCGSVVDQHGSSAEQRIRHAYTSLGNAVRIRLHVISSQNSESSSDAPRFLLHYQAFGCEDPVMSDEGAWFRRSGDVATVGCHSGVTDDADVTSTLTCVGGNWVGPTHICNSVLGPADALQVLGLAKFPPATSILIVVTISLCVGGIIIFTAGFIHVCRSRRRQDGDVRTSRSMTADDVEAYNKSSAAGAWTSRRLADLSQHSTGAADPPSEYYHHQQLSQHRDSNEYASIWEPWPADDPARRPAGSRDGELHGYYGSTTAGPGRPDNDHDELSAGRRPGKEHPYQRPSVTHLPPPPPLPTSASPPARYLQLNSINGSSAVHQTQQPVFVPRRCHSTSGT